MLTDDAVDGDCLAHERLNRDVRVHTAKVFVELHDMPLCLRHLSPVTIRVDGVGGATVKAPGRPCRIVSARAIGVGGVDGDDDLRKLFWIVERRPPAEDQSLVRRGALLVERVPVAVVGEFRPALFQGFLVVAPGPERFAWLAAQQVVPLSDGWQGDALPAAGLGGLDAAREIVFVPAVHDKNNGCVRFLAGEDFRSVPVPDMVAVPFRLGLLALLVWVIDEDDVAAESHDAGADADREKLPALACVPEVLRFGVGG